MKRMLLSLTVALFGVACDNANQNAGAPAAPASPTPAPATPPGMPHAPPAGSANGAAGITWTAPPSWKAGAPRPMRLATWTIPKAAGDTEDGECAVFFFGAGMGGDVEANIQRWYGQLKPADGKPIATTAKRSEITSNGIAIVRVDASGTFMWSARPMSPQKIPKPSYRLLGAIAKAPGGSVFFKLTAPAKTAAAAEAAFDGLLASIKKQS